MQSDARLTALLGGKAPLSQKTVPPLGEIRNSLKTLATGKPTPALVAKESRQVKHEIGEEFLMSFGP